MDAVEGGDAFHLVAEDVGQVDAAVAALVETGVVEKVDEVDKGLHGQRVADERQGAAPGQEAGAGDEAVGVEREAALGDVGAGLLGQRIADGAAREPLLGEEVEAVAGG